MKKSYIYLTMLLTVFAFASCVKEFDNGNSAPAKGTMPIEFTIAEDDTRTLLDLTDGKTVVWEDGDVVGLYYRYNIGEEQIVAANASNVPYKYVAATGKFVPVGEPAYWDEGESGTNHNLYVYYPYAEAVEAYNQIVSAVPSAQTYDVTAQSNPIVSDAFAGTRLMNVEFGKKDVEFEPIAQSYAILRLNITNASDSDVVVSKVILTNDTQSIAADKTVMSLASLANKAPKISDITGKSKTITLTVENGAVAAGGCMDVRLLIVPNYKEGDYHKTYEGSKFTVTVTSDYGEHPAIEFDGGMIEVGGRAAKNIVLQAPSTSDEPSAPEYEIGQVVDGGVLYKVDGTTGYVLYPYAGAKGVWDNAVSYCENVASQTNEAWYLPSESELKELFNIYTANDNPNGDTGSPYNFKVAPSALADKYLDARAKFDGYILSCAADGQILNTQAADQDGDVAWSSTVPSDATNAKMVRFGKAGAMSKKKTEKYYARCIKRVDLTSVDQPETEQTYPAPTAGEEGEYDVYLLIGQSNMAGRGELLDEDKVAIPNVYLLNTEGEIEPAKNPLNIYSSIRKGASTQKMGPGASFASTIAEQTGKKVLLVVNARGGSAIAHWQKGVTTSGGTNTYGPSEATSADFYADAVSRTQQAMQYGALKGILWHQGCSDQNNTSYMSQLMTLANNLRADLGGDVPFIAGQLGDWRSSTVNFNTNIKSIGQYLTYSDWISSEGGVPIVTKNSNGEPDLTDPHFNRASQILIGKRYAQKILKMVYEKDYTVE